MKSNFKNWQHLAAIIGLGWGLAIAPESTALAGPPAPQIYPPDQAIFGLTYAQWSAKWWEWAFSLPTSVNPWFDTGENALIGQSGPVYFLTGVFPGPGEAKRKIAVPTETPLFIPIYNAFADNVEVDPPMTIQELRDLAASFIGPVESMYLRVDGAEVRDLSRYRVKSAPFCDWLPRSGNVFKTVFKSKFWGWNCPVVSDGYWVMLAPLPAGDHMIAFGYDDIDFPVKITYEIQVFQRTP